VKVHYGEGVATHTGPESCALRSMTQRLRKRDLRKCPTPRLPVAGTFQIRFRAACNSLNTAVAVAIKVPMPTRVAMIPDRVLLALLSIACTARTLVAWL